VRAVHSAMTRALCFALSRTRTRTRECFQMRWIPCEMAYLYLSRMVAFVPVGYEQRKEGQVRRSC